MNKKAKVTQAEFNQTLIYTAGFFLGYDACFQKMIGIAKEVDAEATKAFEKLDETCGMYIPILEEHYEIVSQEEADADRAKPAVVAAPAGEKKRDASKAAASTPAEFQFLEAMKGSEIVEHVYEKTGIQILFTPKDKRGVIKKAIKALQGIS